jgi:hypothetical protein
MLERMIFRSLTGTCSLPAAPTNQNSIEWAMYVRDDKRDKGNSLDFRNADYSILVSLK